MTWWKRAYRRLAYGKPIIVVSGLPRSGTSMMMKMLEAGGVPVWHDGVRAADDRNPHGYYELERVKELNTGSDKAWVREGRGRAVKVISLLLDDLPRTNNYKVIFMHRGLKEVLTSQANMLAARGHEDVTEDDVLRRHYERHLRRVNHLLSHDLAFTILDIEYADVVKDPRRTAESIGRFIGGALDIARMTAAVDAQLYRSRAAKP